MLETIVAGVLGRVGGCFAVELGAEAFEHGQAGDFHHFTPFEVGTIVAVGVDGLHGEDVIGVVDDRRSAFLVEPVFAAPVTEAFDGFIGNWLAAFLAGRHGEGFSRLAISSAFS